MKVYMAVDSLNYGDGVGKDVLEKAEIVRELGYDCEIYVSSCDERLQGSCKDIGGLQCGRDDLIFHHYAGESCIVPVVLKQPCKKIMIYHNITPPEFFREGITKTVCENGYRQLKDLNEKYDFYIGVSAYNLEDLRSKGVTGKMTVWPIVVDFARNEDAVKAIHEECNFLFVGRIAPNKKIEDIIDVFDFYHCNINSHSTLTFVGNETIFPEYYDALLTKITFLNSRTAICFRGKISDEEKDTVFRNSDVYLSMSEHEGFGIPLLEAMSYGIPVFSFDAAAYAGDGIS